MSKLKIEHAASKVHLVLLKTNIEDGISADIDLMAEWSKNDRKYLINELLRFALAQAEDFQKYKAERPAASPRPQGETRKPQPPMALPSEKGPVA